MAAKVYRPEKLSESQRAEFVEKATALHQMIRDASRNLKPFGPDYTALHEVNNSICEGIQAVTGEPPLWTRGNPTPDPYGRPR